MQGETLKLKNAKYLFHSLYHCKYSVAMQ